MRFTALHLLYRPQLGGKFGRDLMNQLNVEFMSDLLQFSEKHLQDMFGYKSA